MSVFRNFDCLSLVVCSHATLLKLQTVLFLFFSKFCASKSGVRLIFGCGLYTDVYGKCNKKLLVNKNIQSQNQLFTFNYIPVQSYKLKCLSSLKVGNYPHLNITKPLIIVLGHSVVRYLNKQFEENITYLNGIILISI